MDIVTSSTSDNQNMYDYINGVLMNPSAFIILIIIIVLYVLLFTSLGESNTGLSTDYNYNSQPVTNTNMSVIIIVIIVFAILALINGIQYFFGINVIANIKNIFSGTPEIDIGINQITSDQPTEVAPIPNATIPEITIAEQVYNIPGNYYGYEDAKTLCSAYGSRLATYDEVEDSYNKGGEWCNYGWSEGQMALFPTQKKTFNTLQSIAGHENDCGRPGINGGFMANPRLQFGVNCYGYKPNMTSEEEQLMQTNTPYPKTEKDILMEKRVDYWKNKLDEILVSPFNYSTWSRV